MFGIRKRQTERVLAVLKDNTLSASNINEAIKRNYGNRHGMWLGSLIVLLMSLEEANKLRSYMVPGPRRQQQQRMYTRV